MNIIDMPANPAHMGIPEINKPNALPNKRIARTYSFIADFPYNFLRLDSRLHGYDVCGICIILIVLLSFPRRRVSREMGKFDFLRDCQVWLFDIGVWNLFVI
jgi:hypothetical protein